MNISAVITGYDDLISLRYVIEETIKCDFQEIILAVGGNDGTRDYVYSLEDPRITVLFEEGRAGKTPSLKRAIANIKGDAVFMICSDIYFKSGELWHLLDYLRDGTAAVIPSVLPSNNDTFVSRVARTLWNVRNHHLKLLDSMKKTLHGGEVLVCRAEILKDMEDVINDDAYICLHAAELGFRTRYAADVTVNNIVPDNFKDLITQRKRVNFGHLELKRMKKIPSVMNSEIVNNTGIFLEVLGNVVREKPSEIFYLPFLVLVEIISIILARRDYGKHLDLTVWPIVGSKGEPGRVTDKR